MSNVIEFKSTPKSDYSLVDDPEYAKIVNLLRSADCPDEVINEFLQRMLQVFS